MMGSGVTVGEARKLGCRVIGRDINPVSYLLVKSFVNDYSIPEIADTFEEIKKDLSEKIKSYYKTLVQDGDMADVLYYFWVKVILCPFCGNEIDLFPSRVFSMHAYPKKNPMAKSVCPYCNAINSVVVSDVTTKCNSCGMVYNLQKKLPNKNQINCSRCNRSFSIIESIRKQDSPPSHRMYAKMVLTSRGEKQYDRITDYDLMLYRKASEDLQHNTLKIPKVAIQNGHNTDQILNYNYRYWHQLFNDRQLLCLGILAERIGKIENEQVRELFACLFSGCLEFNNMFCSFKGEGTGAVRHMFAHHILKPERTPLEANIWGTPKSSGSFSTLFEQRLMRALEYKSDPFELQLDSRTNATRKIRHINHSVSGRIASTYSQFKQKTLYDVYLSCGSSDKTDIEDRSVDLVVTDPPFFANVHYSELADFFYVWQKEILDGDIFKPETTRSLSEIQQVNVGRFTDNLTAVFTECNRVLRIQGMMVFTFHNSQTKGWEAILKSLRRSGFCVEANYFVKSEMSVAVPKTQAKSPINFDAIMVCRKIEEADLCQQIPSNLLDDCATVTRANIRKFSQTKKMSRNDVKNILLSNVVKMLSSVENLEDAIEFIESNGLKIECLAEEIHKTESSASTQKGKVLLEWEPEFAS
jgi:adenine-specific DNA methylase